MARKATGLRRSVLRSKKSRGKSSGWRGNWRDRFDIPKGGATHILLTRGDYPNPGDLDEKRNPGISHYHTCGMHQARVNKKGGPGSFFTSRCALDAAVAGGGTEDDADCLPCLRMEEGDKRFGYQVKPTFSFNLLHLALYERTHAVRDGKKQYYEKDFGENIKRGDPIMRWEEVTKPKAKKRIIDDIEQRLEGGDVRMMSKKYVEVGTGFRDQLASIDDESSKMCMCGGDLTPIAFVCERCEEVLAHVEGDPEDDDDDGMSDREVAEFAANRQRCEECGHQGFPVIEPVCSDCDDPQALTPFDVVVLIRKRGEGTNTTLIFDEVIPLTEFELANGESLLEWDDEDEPVLDSEGNWKFNEEFDIEKLATNQFDFEKVHQPRDNSWIANRLGCHNPFGETRSTSGRSSKYRNYGRGSGETEDTDDDDSEDSGTATKRPARKRRTRRKRAR